MDQICLNYTIFLNWSLSQGIGQLYSENNFKKTWTKGIEESKSWLKVSKSSVSSILFQKIVKKDENSVWFLISIDYMRDYDEIGHQIEESVTSLTRF